MYESEAERVKLLQEVLQEQAATPGVVLLKSTLCTPRRRNFAPNLTARVERLAKRAERVLAEPAAAKPEHPKRCESPVPKAIVKRVELAKPQKRLDRQRIKLPPRIPSQLDLAIARALQRPPRGTQIPEAENRLRATATAVRGRYNPQANEAFERELSRYRNDPGEEHF